MASSSGTTGGFEVTPSGRLLVRNIAMIFDRHLRARTAQRAGLLEDDLTGPIAGRTRVSRRGADAMIDAWRREHTEHDDVSGGDCGGGHRGTLDCFELTRAGAGRSR